MPNLADSDVWRGYGGLSAIEYLDAPARPDAPAGAAQKLMVARRLKFVAPFQTQSYSYSGPRLVPWDISCSMVLFSRILNLMYID